MFYICKSKPNENQMMLNMAAKDENIKSRRKKSIVLSSEDYKSFKSYAKSFHTVADCADDCGIARGVITRILEVKRCNQATYDALINKGIISGENNYQTAYSQPAA